MQYSLFSNDSGENITVFINGKLLSATDQHPHFQMIKLGVLSGDESVADLFDLTQKVSERFEQLSERVSVSNGRVYFDGEEIDSELTQQITRFVEQGVEDWRPLVNFFEKVMTNLQEHTRDQLFRWVRKQNLTITEDGNFLAYKGVEKNSAGDLVSVSSGTAVVDGVVRKGQIPNNVGSVITMPRNEVTHDPTVGCAQGLHAGTYDYAMGWARDALLVVEINPRDVVSVPTDCDSAKLRVCRYVVKEVIEKELEQALWSDANDDEDSEIPGRKFMERRGISFEDDDYYDDDYDEDDDYYM